MKSSIIFIYLVFTGFIFFNNNIITEREYQSNYKHQNLTDNSSCNYFASVLSGGKLNHKLNHNKNLKFEIIYLNDAASVNKLITYDLYNIYPYIHLILHKRINVYHKDKFLPIFTQSDKTIQSEFLII